MKQYQNIFKSSKIMCIVHFFDQYPEIKQYIQELTLKEQYAAKSIVAIGQGPIVFRIPDNIEDPSRAFTKLINHLVTVEKSYDMIGGIIGYHLKIIECLDQEANPTHTEIQKQFFQPPTIDITKNTHRIKKNIYDGICSLPLMGKIFPVGGTGERLNLHDNKTGKPLPAAKLCFMGDTLLAGLIKDIQAREYLYYKLFHKQRTTPIAMMTSHSKNNHQYIQDILQQNNWFNRPSTSYAFFVQPGVPVINKEGNWSLKSPLSLNLQPGGHGVIWKLAKDQGIFNWFYENNRYKTLIRQINNPIAGTDYGLLTLIGIGCRENKAFGFASCSRLVNASEGVNILIKTQKEDRYHYCTSNIEYTNFKKYHIQDVPVKAHSPYSKFPSNTNVLFADLPSIESVVTASEIPGLLINMKNMKPFIDAAGKVSEVPGGRLESTMQNIADSFIDTFDKPIRSKEARYLKTFVTYNQRIKTISAAKNAYVPKKNRLETPESCFYDILCNAHDLLNNYCKFQVPKLEGLEKYLEEGPPFLLQFHPALGPIYSVIAQKIRGGKISPHSELLLDITELDMHNLSLQGSLVIRAENALGHKDSDGLIIYGDDSGKCELKNVRITIHI